MTLNEMIKILKSIKDNHGGDIEVRVLSLSHSWAPEPVVRPVNGGKPCVVLNP